jgi:hypothetical protein
LLLDALDAALRDWRQSETLDDDVSVLVLERTPRRSIGAPRVLIGRSARSRMFLPRLLATLGSAEEGSCRGEC